MNKRKVADKYRLAIKKLGDEQERLYRKAVKELGYKDEPGNLLWDYLFNSNDSKKWRDRDWKTLTEAGDAQKM